MLTNSKEFRPPVCEKDFSQRIMKIKSINAAFFKEFKVSGLKLKIYWIVIQEPNEKKPVLFYMSKLPLQSSCRRGRQ